MAVQNKPFPSASTQLLILLFRLAPFLGFPAAGAAVGFQLLYLIPIHWRAYLLIPYLVLFLAMTILDSEPGWNLVLLLGFSLTAGTILNWSGAAVSRGLTWGLFLGLVGAALGSTTSLGPWVLKRYRVLLVLMICYLLGWLTLVFWDLITDYQVIWMIFGLLLFTLISTGILQKSMGLNPEDSPVPPAIKLFVVFFNIFWLAGLV